MSVPGVLTTSGKLKYAGHALEKFRPSNLSARLSFSKGFPEASQYYNSTKVLPLGFCAFSGGVCVSPPGFDSRALAQSLTKKSITEDAK